MAKLYHNGEYLGGGGDSSLDVQSYIISANNWSSTPTIASNLVSYYTYQLSLRHNIRNEIPSIWISATQDGLLPKPKEQAAFNCIDYITAIDSSTLMLYAQAKPNDDFAILVRS